MQGDRGELSRWMKAWCRKRDMGREELASLLGFGKSSLYSTGNGGHELKEEMEWALRALPMTPEEKRQLDIAILQHKFKWQFKDLPANDLNLKLYSMMRRSLFYLRPAQKIELIEEMKKYFQPK